MRNKEERLKLQLRRLASELEDLKIRKAKHRIIAEADLETLIDKRK